MTEVYIYHDENVTGNWKLAHEYGLKITDALKDSGFPFMNVTHTGAYVAVARSTFPVGIDAELKSRKVKDASGVEKKMFAPSEILWVGEDTERFLRLWTVKEAYGKMLGKGLLYDCSGTEFVFDDDKIHGPSGTFISQFMPDGLILSVCTASDSDKIHIFSALDVAKLLHIS